MGIVTLLITIQLQACNYCYEFILIFNVVDCQNNVFIEVTACMRFLIIYSMRVSH